MKDPSIFIYSKGKDVIMLLLYVDDMLITGNTSEVQKRFLEDISNQFRMKDLGQMEYFLGIQAKFHESGLFLSQERYALDLLAAAGMSDCFDISTPLPIRLNKVPDQNTIFASPSYFRSLAGKLQYLTLTRPDLQFSVNYICQKMHAPSISDYRLLKCILRYVKGTIDHGINFAQDTDFTLRAYSDSDWAGCPHTRRSTGGFCTFLGSNIILWSSKKQPTVSRSSTEAEYRSLSETASELSWICSVMREIGVPVLITPELYCDNLSSVHLTANPTYHKRSKHFELDCHYVRERVALGALVVRHVPGYLQLADIFTKSLPYTAFDDLRFKLGISSPPTPSLRGTINKKDQNDAASVKDHKGMGLEKQRPKSEESPSANIEILPAQRLSLKQKEKDKIEVQKVTQERRDGNGVSLYNKFSALDLLDD